MLTLDGWLEFNRAKWGLSPLRLNFGDGVGGRPAIETVIYTDNRGRIKIPKLNAYLPVTFMPTDTESKSRLERQWLSVSDLMVEEFKSRGVVNAVSLPPSVIDMRPWKWSNFEIHVNYSYYITIPYNYGAADRSVRNKIKKAVNLGYVCERTSRMIDVHECLQSTADRQDFDYRLTVEDLELCESLLGREVFRSYVCYAPNGEAASSRVVLCYPQSTAVDWVAGTKSEHLKSGCTQLLIYFVLDDLAGAKVSGFDYAGANIPNVAAAKATWGGILTPYYTIRQPNARSLARHVIDLLRFYRDSNTAKS